MRSLVSTPRHHAAIMGDTRCGLQGVNIPPTPTPPPPAHPSAPCGQGFENRRINLTLLFGPQRKPSSLKDNNVSSEEAKTAAAARAQERTPGVWYTGPQAMREVPPEEAGELRYCI